MECIYYCLQTFIIPLFHELLFLRVYNNEDGALLKCMWNIRSVTTMPIISSDTATLIDGTDNRWNMYTSLTCRKINLSFASFEAHHS